MRHSRRLLLLQSRAAAALTFLLRDDFITADDAPVTSPRTCEPGPGELVHVQIDGNQSISSGKLNIPAPSAASWTTQGVYENTDGGRARVAGLAALWKVNFSTSNLIMFGWSDKQTLNTSFPAGFYGASTFFATRTGYTIYSNGLPTGVEYTLAVVLRLQGFYAFGKGGVLGSDWTLLAVHRLDASDNTPVWWKLTNRASELTLDDLHIPNLNTDGYTVFGHRDLDKTAGLSAPSASDTFTHTADAILSFDCDTLPSADAVVVKARIQDATNYWQLTIDSAGTIDLDEVVAGSPTQRGTANGVLSGGEHIEWKMLDDDMVVWHDNTLAFTYASATNFTTATDGEVGSEGTGGVITTLVACTLDSAGSGGNGTQGYATDLLPGPLAAGDTLTHEADFFLTLEVDALPSSGQIEVEFRQAAANTNTWRVTVDSSGDIDLDELVAGSPTQRGTSAAAISAGEIVIIECKDETIKVSGDNVLLVTYNSAANYKTATAGEVETLGTGGLLSDLVTTPATPSGEPLRGLQQLAI